MSRFPILNQVMSFVRVKNVDFNCTPYKCARLKSGRIPWFSQNVLFGKFALFTLLTGRVIVFKQRVPSVAQVWVCSR